MSFVLNTAFVPPALGYFYYFLSLFWYDPLQNLHFINVHSHGMVIHLTSFSNYPAPHFPPKIRLSAGRSRGLSILLDSTFFYSAKKLSRALLPSSPAVFLDVGKLRRMIIWSGSAVPLEARSECFLLSWMEDLFELWQSQGWWNGRVSIFLIPLRERKREELVGVEKDHQVWHLFF